MTVMTAGITMRVATTKGVAAGEITEALEHVG
jgi:hypothetical protein